MLLLKELLSQTPNFLILAAMQRGVIKNLILQMKNLSLGKGMKISCSHSTSRWKRWDLNPVLLDSQVSDLSAMAVENIILYAILKTQGIH